MNRRAGAVDQHRALAADRLGDQRPLAEAPGPVHSTVGWNCMNSTSATSAPARRAMATPSPVAPAGLVVAANSWPAPPVASTTARARTSPTRRRRPSSSTHARPRSRAAVAARRRPAATCARAARCRGRAARRASARRPRPRWRRHRRARPGRGGARPRGSAPACRRRHGRSGAARAQPRTAAGPRRRGCGRPSSSHRPAPAARVSATCSVGRRRRRRATAATPPCAQRVGRRRARPW